jgi:acyl-CoA synthetase (AMP-forming)/AMP-acid ligase II
MHINFVLSVCRENSACDAIVWQDRIFSYGDLLRAIERWFVRIDEAGIPQGAITSIEADFSVEAVALLLVLINRNCIIVPLTTSVEAKKPEFRKIAEVEWIVKISNSGDVTFENTGQKPLHEINLDLKRRQHPGLVLFSSGSTGASKAAVHDFLPILEKFKVRRQTLRAIAFLLFDHIGGINTILYNLSNGGCIVTVQDRSPEYICKVIEKYKVELLPTSPTFINMLLVSKAYENHDISSLQTVTYGTEPMPESTLQKMHALFPEIKMQQTYGLSEVGIMRSKSRSSDSLWVKIGGEGFETRVVEGLLEIKARSAMLGYLNAPSPFTEDGWFKTGDAVEVDGEYFRILGRKSEMINVGGEKVYPAEVESVLQTMEGVEDVAVNAEENRLTGQIVKATVRLSTDENLAAFRKRMYEFCKGKLAKYKIPQKVVLTNQEMHGERFKKMRREVG